MVSKEGQPAGKDTPGNYEAAVLDFLEKEMASVQPASTAKKQSEELDALVADLLKQVITESNQPQALGKAPSNEMSELLAEFAPQQETVSHQETKSASSNRAVAPSQAADSRTKPDAHEQESIDPLELEFSDIKKLKRKAARHSATGARAVSFVRKNRIPLTAAAVVCALAIVGFTVYHFSGSSSKEELKSAAPSSQIAASTPIALPVVNQTVAVSSKPTVQTKAPQAAPKITDKKASDVNSSKPAPPAPAEKTPAAVAVTKPAAPAPAPTTPNPTPSKEEKPKEAQASPVTPAASPAVTPSTVSEKPAPIAVSEVVTPVSAPVEIKPASPPPAAPVSVENNQPASQPQPSLPVVSRNLIPAVVIAQVSPKYPEFALRTRTSAAVVMELDVDEKGRVTKATPLSGPDMFYKEAMNAAMKWRYKPASIGGTNVSSQVKVTFTFNFGK